MDVPSFSVHLLNWSLGRARYDRPFPRNIRSNSTQYLFSAIGRQLIDCSETELATLQPPAGESCGTFMAQFISNRGGYLTNPDDVSNCRFCSSRTTDQWMEPSFNIFYSHHWRDFGLFCAYILFNVRLVCCFASMGLLILFFQQIFLVYFLTYMVRVRSHKRLAYLSKKAMGVISKFKKSS